MTRPRIRTVKPEWWKREQVVAVSRDARLLYLGLRSMSDDAGRLRFTPAAVMGHVYPYDNDITPGKVTRWVDELAREGLVLPYGHGERSYVWVCDWQRDERINRPTPSVLPAPPSPLGSWYPHDGNLTPESHADSVNGSVRPQ